MRGNIWCREISRRCANNFRKWSNFSRGADLLCTNCAAKLPLFALILHPSTGLTLPVCWLFRPCGLDLPPFAACRTLEIIHFVAFCPPWVSENTGKTLCGTYILSLLGGLGYPPPCVLGRRPGYPLQNSRYSKPPKFATIPTTEIRGSNSSEEGIMEEVGESGRGVEMFGCCGEFVFASFVGQSEGHGGG